MAMRALLSGGKSPDPYYPEFEIRHMVELEDIDAATAADYKANKAAAFNLKILTADESKILSNLAAPEISMMGGQRTPQFGAMVAYAVKHGLVGWRNIQGQNGDAIPFKGREDRDGNIIGAADEDVAAIPEDVRIELFVEIDRLRRTPTGLFH